MIRPRLILLAALLACGVPLGVAAADPAPVVATDTGPLRGLLADGVREYRGIPFALPPVGERRFAPPVAQTRWGGTLNATRARSPCPQVVRYGQTDASDDEDCLYLNIAVPAAPAAHGPRPVLVWIHGGAYVGGSADIYPLAYLARRGDLVVVSINYRLGVFGFMTHPAFEADHNGALGLEDQREALRWIRRNIRAFGGDPQNVTLAGESAGAASVCLQLAAPREASGLFQKAIIQSLGCTVRLRTQAEAGATGRAVAARVGCDDAATALACLRAKPVNELLQAQVAVGAGDARAFAPSVGSISTPRPALEAFASGDIVRVPILNGGNRDEMRLYVGYEVAGGKPVTAATLPERLSALYGGQAAKVAAEYPLPAGMAPPAWLGRIESDYLPGAPLANCLILTTARLAARHVPVYEYEFTDPDAPPVMPDPGFEMGAVHSAELPYLFPHISYNHRIDGPDVPATSRALSERMVAYWSAFAHTGRPDAGHDRPWPRYQGDGDVLRLDPREGGAFNAWGTHHCAFWQSLYPDALP
ncbi:MAG: carboxylesterase family protein [Proteobacteria bacterium]|nr:carboxylesterase family protein [Pseudomonadota bacterium]